MIAGVLGHHSEAATAAVRLGHDADIVAAGRKQVRHFGVGQEVDLVGAKIGTRMSVSATGLPAASKRPSAFPRTPLAKHPDSE
jgi:hypothetical protein